MAMKFGVKASDGKTYQVTASSGPASGGDGRVEREYMTRIDGKPVRLSCTRAGEASAVEDGRTFTGEQFVPSDQ
jgi:hypothetical protein